MSGKKSRPPHATGGARRRLEPAGSGIGVSSLPEPSYRISHISVEEEPEHSEEEEKRPVDPDLCHNLPFQNLCMDRVKILLMSLYSTADYPVRLPEVFLIFPGF